MCFGVSIELCPGYDQSLTTSRLENLRHCPMQTKKFEDVLRNVTLQLPFLLTWLCLIYAHMHLRYLFCALPLSEDELDLVNVSFCAQHFVIKIKIPEDALWSSADSAPP